MAGLPETTSRRGLLVGLAVGLPVIAYGVRGLLVDADRTQPAELARWIVGAAVVNDALSPTFPFNREPRNSTPESRALPV